MGIQQISCANCSGDRFRELVTVEGNRGVEFISNRHRVVVCTNCGLAFLNPRHEDRDYERYYRTFNFNKNKTPSKFNVLEDYKYKRIPIKFMADCLMSEGVLEKRARAIDIGCGFGAALHFMREYGLEAEGLEPSLMASEFADRYFGTRIHVGSIFDHDLPLGQYDIVSSMAVIEHLTDPPAAIGEMRKLLKPGGILFVNTPDLKGMSLRKGIDRYFKFVHTFYFTNVTLSSLIQSAGFEIISTWQMQPIMKYSTLIHPTNFVEGQLNIVARKKEPVSNSAPQKDDVDEIFRIFRAARRRDEMYARLHRVSKMKIVGYPLRKIRKRLSKPAYVFRDYFRGQQIVSDYRTLFT